MTMPFSRTGSAVTNVVRCLVKAHPGPSTVITSHNRDVEVEGADNIRADFTGACPREWFDRFETMTDHLFGFLGRERPFTGQLPLAGLIPLRERNPDVIFVHEGHYASSSLPLFRRWFPRAKLFLYVHTAPARSYTPRELHRLLSHTDGVVCVSPYIVGLVRSRLGRHADKIRVHAVLNGVDTAKFSPPETAPSSNSLLFVGKVDETKGTDLAVEAAKLLPPGVHLRCIGSSVHGATQDLAPFEVKLRAMAASAPAGVKITFEPFQPNDQLPGIYRSAGIVVVPSRFQDPCPLVCLEALASGCAVVGADRGGIGAICGDSAQVVPPEAPALAGALHRLVADPAVYSDYRARARARALELQWDNQYRKLIEFVASTS